MVSTVTESAAVFSLPRASSFSPKVRIVAWSDQTSIRRRFIYGSQTSLTVDTTTPVCKRSHDSSLESNQNLRPQSIPYRPKSGVLSGRPCSAPPPPTDMKKRENLRVSTLNIALPTDLTTAKPMYKLEPKIPPKKHAPWSTPDYLKPAKSVVLIRDPSPLLRMRLKRRSRSPDRVVTQEALSQRRQLAYGATFTCHIG